MDEFCDDCEGGGNRKEEKEVDNCDLESAISFLKQGFQLNICQLQICLEKEKLLAHRY